MRSPPRRCRRAGCRPLAVHRTGAAVSASAPIQPQAAQTTPGAANPSRSRSVSTLPCSSTSSVGCSPGAARSPRPSRSSRRPGQELALVLLADPVHLGAHDREDVLRRGTRDVGVDASGEDLPQLGMHRVLDRRADVLVGLAVDGALVWGLRPALLVLTVDVVVADQQLAQPVGTDDEHLPGGARDDRDGPGRALGRPSAAARDVGCDCYDDDARPARPRRAAAAPPTRPPGRTRTARAPGRPRRRDQRARRGCGRGRTATRSARRAPARRRVPRRARQPVDERTHLARARTDDAGGTRTDRDRRTPRSRGRPGSPPR